MASSETNSAPLGIKELIRESQEHPAIPVIDGLLNEYEIAGLHGSPESFKTTLSLQIAEALATGQPLLGIWRVPRRKVVYFLETEMSVPALGTRLSTMFRDRCSPENVRFASEGELRQFRKAPHMASKFDLLRTWIIRANAEVLVIDTCNPFFRHSESPNDETTVGFFFDMLSVLPVSTKVFVRHNHKPRMDDLSGEGAARIRGSGQFADVPDLLLEISRMDKRTNRAELAVTKFRHGTKPDLLPLWFDGSDLRLIALPPVIHLLQQGPMSREELLTSLQKRFGVAQRLGDEMIAEAKSVLREYQRGHEKLFEINREAERNEGWYHRMAR